MCLASSEKPEVAVVRISSVKFIIPLVIFPFVFFFIFPSQDHFQAVVLSLLCAKCQE